MQRGEELGTVAVIPPAPPGKREQRRQIFNGHTGEYIRWALSLVFAAIVAWGVVTGRLSVLEARQQTQFEELIRRFQVMQDDIRELRRKP